MRQIKFIVIILCLLTQLGITSQNEFTVRDALKSSKFIAYPENGRPVNQTVAEELKNEIIPHANIFVVSQKSKIVENGVLRISIADENLSPIPQNLKQVGAKEEDIPLLSKNAIESGVHLATPRKVELKDMEALFRGAFQ